MPESTLDLSSSPARTRAVYQEVLDELDLEDQKLAKKVLKQRITEVERLRALLAKAEKDLEKLLQKPVSEIAALQAQKVLQGGYILPSPSGGGAYVPLVNAPW